MAALNLQDKHDTEILATGVACQQGTLTLPDTWFRPPFWDLLMLQLLRPNSSNLPCLYSTFYLEYPLVLSRFCFVVRNFSGVLMVFRGSVTYPCFVNHLNVTRIPLIKRYTRLGSSPLQHCCPVSMHTLARCRQRIVLLAERWCWLHYVGLTLAQHTYSVVLVVGCTRW